MRKIINQTFKARGRLLNLEVEMRIFMDEPPALGGSNLGPNPVETLLAALGGCALVVVSKFASSVGVEVTEANAEVEGTLDLNGFRGRLCVRAGSQKIFEGHGEVI
ncbi:MAG: OsmC family protein [Nitrososphaeria archaeon]